MESSRNAMKLTKKEKLKMQKRKSLKVKFQERLYGQILLEIPKHLLKITLFAVIGSFVFMIFIISSDKELSDFMNLAEE